MFLDVAGNAFLHKERSGGGKVVALWHLRPDRVQVIPDAARHIRGYEYRLGGIPYFLPVADVIHLKTRAVWDDYYGLPPLAVAAQWVDIGNAAASFTRAFFRNAGVPSGLLNIQRSVSVAERELIRGQFRSEYGGPAGWHQTLVLDGGDAAYTAMGLPLGERGIALAALDELIEAHVVRPFGVPLELIGARLSMRGQRSAVPKRGRASGTRPCAPVQAHRGAAPDGLPRRAGAGRGLGLSRLRPVRASRRSRRTRTRSPSGLPRSTRAASSSGARRARSWATRPPTTTRCTTSAARRGWCSQMKSSFLALPPANWKKTH
jgi:hypothetical protein